MVVVMRGQQFFVGIFLLLMAPVIALLTWAWVVARRDRRAGSQQRLAVADKWRTVRIVVVVAMLAAAVGWFVLMSASLPDLP